MALELECNLVKKLDVINGTSGRGPWSKQEFIVQYQDGNYPTQLVLNVWGAEKVADLAQYQPGDRMKISLTPSSREFNGRWYTDIRAWKIERSVAGAPVAATAATPAATPVAATPAAAQAPAAPVAPVAAPAPTPAAIDLTEGDDDLPF